MDLLVRIGVALLVTVGIAAVLLALGYGLIKLIQDAARNPEKYGL